MQSGKGKGAAEVGHLFALFSSPDHARFADFLSNQYPLTGAWSLEVLVVGVAKNKIMAI